MLGMSPSLHYKATKFITFGTWGVGLLCWWMWGDTNNVLPVVLILICTLALAFLSSVIPARCPECGENRAYVLREQLPGNTNLIKYKCSSCGHVHHTGIHESISEE